MEVQPLHEHNRNIAFNNLQTLACIQRKNNYKSTGVFTLRFSGNRQKDINEIIHHLECQKCKQSKQLYGVFEQFYDIIFNIKMQKKSFSKLLKTLKEEIKTEKNNFRQQKYQYQALTQIYQKQLRNISKMHDLCSAQLLALKDRQIGNSQNNLDCYIPKQFSSPIRYLEKSLQKQICQTQIKRNVQKSQQLLKSERSSNQAAVMGIRIIQFGQEIQQGNYETNKKFGQSSNKNSNWSSRVSKISKQKHKQRQTKWNNSINLLSMSQKSKNMKTTGLSSSRKII